MLIKKEYDYVSGCHWTYNREWVVGRCRGLEKARDACHFYVCEQGIQDGFQVSRWGPVGGSTLGRWQVVGLRGQSGDRPSEPQSR